MTRRFVDRDLMEWEAFATTPRGGLPAPGRIVFRPMTIPEARSRYFPVDGDRSDAEARIVSATEEQLRAFLAEAEELP